MHERLRLVERRIESDKGERAINALNIRANEKITFKELGRRLGVSGGRAKQIVDYGGRLLDEKSWLLKNIGQLEKHMDELRATITPEEAYVLSGWARAVANFKTYGVTSWQENLIQFQHHVCR